MANRYHAGPPSDHFDGTRFFNPGHPPTDRSLADMLRWRWGEDHARWPARVPVVPAVPARHVVGLRITMVGHATALVQAAGRAILTDPVWAERAGPFGRLGPRRATAPGIAFADLPPIDAVMLSHNHYDHCDLATLAALVARDAPLVVTPLGNDAILRRAIPAVRVAAGDWGDRIAIDAGMAATLVPAHHWSARGIGDRRMALWGGFVLETPAGRLWFAGDTGYGDGALFAAIGRDHGPFDAAMIPIGAYAPRWFMAAQHCDPEEAVRMFAAVGAARAIGIHWGCFNLTDEPREEPARRLAAAVAAAGIAPDRFVAAEPGHVYDL